MKYAALAPLAAALSLAPSLVAGAASSGTLGFALGTKNPDGTCKKTTDYEADFDAIAKNSAARLVRMYSASDCYSASNVLPAAKAKNFKVVLGIWPDVPTSYNQDLGNISTYAPQYKDVVWGVSVGSETMYRKNFTGAQLASKIQDVNNTLHGQFRLGTADTWNTYADGTADDLIKSGPDFLFANAFAFWQGSTINNASHTYLDDIAQAFQHVESVAGIGKIDLWTGETGWPTNSTETYEQAQGGLANTQQFWKQGICTMLTWGYNVFVFEAFDEPWKPASIGLDGASADETHWGFMNADRTTKFPLQC